MNEKDTVTPIEMQVAAVIRDGIGNGDGVLAIARSALKVMGAVDLNLQIVAEYRCIHGSEGAAALWKKLRLPSPDIEPSSEKDPEPPKAKDMMAHIRDFLEQCTEKDPGSQEIPVIMHAAYNRWAQKTGAPQVPTVSGFGRYIRRSGILIRKASTSYYCGIRLKPEWDA